MSRTIPKANAVSTSQIKRQTLNTTSSSITFSFEALEWTEYFNLDGTCGNWSRELFDMMKSVSGMSKKELISGNISKYRVHSHDKASPPSKLPDGVALKDCYQIRISKSKGGIHGVFNDDTFYVIWLDPLHNMYPDDRYGGLRKIRSGSSCCKDREEQLIALTEENKKLQDENDELWQELEVKP